MHDASTPVAEEPAPGRPGGRFRHLQALEDAIKWRRARAAGPCAECAASPGGACDDHARDAELVAEYQAVARQLGAGS